MILLALFLCSIAYGVDSSQPVIADLGIYPLVSFVQEHRIRNSGNSRCSYNGNYGTCYGEVECLALAGTYGNFCPGLQGLCCLFYRSCGQRTSQEVSYFRNVQYPLKDRSPNSCNFQVVKRSTEYCGIRVSMEEADLPTRYDGTCNDVAYQVTGIHNDRLKPKCGKLTGKSYAYGTSNVKEVSINIVSTRHTNALWNLKVEQVKCSDWRGEDLGEDEEEEEENGGGQQIIAQQPAVVWPPPLPTHPPYPTTTWPSVFPQPSPVGGGSVGGTGGSGAGGSSGGGGIGVGESGGGLIEAAVAVDQSGGSGGGGGASIAFACGVKGLSNNRGREHSPRLVSVQGPLGSELHSWRLKTSNTRPIFVDHRVYTKQEKNTPFHRPAQSHPYLPGSIGSDAAVTTTEWGVDDLMDTEFGRFAGPPGPLSTRITFGAQAGVTEFPWQVAMTVNGKFHCGASIISEWHILTAAHCVVSYRNSPSQIDLSIGDWDLATTSEGKSVKGKVSRVTPHPKYSRSNLQNDVAVLKLTEKLKFSEKIRPICLPPPGMQLDGKRAIVTGWGRNEAKRLQSKLHYLEASIMKNSECDKRWSANGATKGFIANTMMCMDSTSGDSCNGDSGGPSVLEYPAGSGSFVQVGIVSFGSGSCTDANLPGVYTRVEKYLHWIRQQMN